MRDDIADKSIDAIGLLNRAALLIHEALRDPDPVERVKVLTNADLTVEAARDALLAARMALGKKLIGPP